MAPSPTCQHWQIFATCFTHGSILHFQHTFTTACIQHGLLDIDLLSPVLTPPATAVPVFSRPWMLSWTFAGRFDCGLQSAQALSYDDLQGLTYLQVKGSGIANTCPVIEGGSTNLKDLKSGTYK